MKKFFYAFAAMTLCTLSVAAQGLSVTAMPGHNWWWNAPERPQLTLEVKDTVGNRSSATLVINLLTDDFTNVSIDTVTATIPGRVTYHPSVAEPGFYRVSVNELGQTPQLLGMNIGYAPEQIVSLPDRQPDFDEFWEAAKKELATVAPQFTLTEMADHSGKERIAYLATMQSIGGDTLRCFVLVPRKKGKYPVHLYLNGYGAQPWYTASSDRPEWIDIVFWARGQGMNKPTNKYGDWIQYGIDQAESQYYRMAYMDHLRLLDFVAWLPEADTRNVFAEGGSQGGAFTLALASLAPGRLRAIAPYIPFLSDFEHYFRIVSWPGSVVQGRAYSLKIPYTQLLRTLSYIDIKNLTSRITCPTLMGAGLQDPTCPPHTNFAGYNLIPSTTPKSFVIYPTCGHTVDYDDWTPRVEAFFEQNRVK